MYNVQFLGQLDLNILFCCLLYHRASYVEMRGPPISFRFLLGGFPGGGGGVNRLKLQGLGSQP